MANCRMKGKGKGLRLLNEDADTGWGGGAWAEEARAVASLKVVTGNDAPARAILEDKGAGDQEGWSLATKDRNMRVGEKIKGKPRAPKMKEKP